MELNEKHIQILEVAEKLFAENSFDGTSVRQIAKEADINVAMISYYFGSKAKMLETLLEYRMGDFKIQIETLISKDISYTEKVDTIVEFVVKRIHKNRRMHKIINFEYSNDSRKIDFENYIQQKEENYKVIEAFVKSGQKKGVFSKKNKHCPNRSNYFGHLLSFLLQQTVLHQTAQSTGCNFHRPVCAHHTYKTYSTNH
jgi:predicted transcriptional regulator